MKGWSHITAHAVAESVSFSGGATMTGAESRERFEASKGALKSIYYVIIGLAITEALSRAVVRGTSFIGIDLLTHDHLPRLLLLIIFLLTICRFVHGSSIHLDAIDRGRFKALFDFVGFLVQASLFYVLSLSLDQPAAFANCFVVLLVVDGAWLAVLLLARYLPFGGTALRWVISDTVLIAFIVVAVRLAPTISLRTILAGTVAAIAATVADYVFDWEFYFPRG